MKFNIFNNAHKCKTRNQIIQYSCTKFHFVSNNEFLHVANQKPCFMLFGVVFDRKYHGQSPARILFCKQCSRYTHNYNAKFNRLSWSLLHKVGEFEMIVDLKISFGTVFMIMINRFIRSADKGNFTDTDSDPISL